MEDFFVPVCVYAFPWLRPGNPIQKPMQLTPGKYINICKQPVSYRHSKSSWSRGHYYFFFYFKWGYIVHIVRHVIYICLCGFWSLASKRWGPKSVARQGGWQVLRDSYSVYRIHSTSRLASCLVRLCTTVSVSGTVQLSSSNSPDCY